MICLTSNLRAQNSLPYSDTLSLTVGDTLELSQKYLTPFGTTLKMGGEEIPTSAYWLDPIRGRIVLKDEKYASRPLVISGRYFPRFLSESYAFREWRVKVDSGGVDTTFYIYEGELTRPQDFFFDTGQLNTQGSISRGVTVGNNQNLTVNSGLRMQIEGDLGDGLKLAAAITDENIPIQPDGTTQQISDFDKVFIQLSKDRDRVILGDYEISHAGTQFANFYRNVQGIQVQVRRDNWGISASGAAAKGKFHTNSFQGAEGKQGPYRLTGKAGERFITILAGSERVYLNGDLLVRGEANDFVIDYNTGELTFTSQRVISSASRIVVDFEYTDRFFNRSLMFTESRALLLNDRLNIRFSYGRDADNPNAPVGDPFTDPEIDSLRTAGDDGLASVPGIFLVDPPDEAGDVQYIRRDTIINSINYERYIFSNADSAVYRIYFSDVGVGNGYYEKDLSGFNGLVFKWVAPDSAGLPTGSYAPVKILQSPKLLQVADLRADFKLTEKVTLYTEAAVSSEDRNRLSPVDDEDNIDLANKTGIRFQKLKVGDSLEVKVDLSHRYVGERYTNLDRVYKMEYGREWNFDDLGERQIENVSEGTAELRYGQRLRLTANAGVRTYGSDLFTLKQQYEAESRHGLLQGKYRFFHATTENSATGALSRWQRHNGDIYKRVGMLQPGVEIWMENKEVSATDSLQSGTFRFYDFKPYFKSAGTDNISFLLYYNYRKEYEFRDSLYRDKSEAHTGYVKVSWNPVPSLSLQNTSSLRRFNLLDDAFSSEGLNDNQTLLNNFQASYRAPKRILYANVLYEVTAEQTARLDVAYIEVNPGQGDYEWIDIDSNGVQSLDEFLFSTNPNRDNFYVRVLVPTQELFPTTAVNLGGNLKLDFGRALARTRNPFLETIRNFSSVTNFRVSQKKEAGDGLAVYLVDIGDVFADTTLLEAQFTFRQDLYFFRNDPLGELKFSFADNRSKQFLSTGEESRSLRFFGAGQRLNFGKNKSLEHDGRLGEKRSEAVNFTTRNYNISFIETNPRVNFQISRKFRLTMGYTFADKRNFDQETDSINSTVDIHKLSFDAKLNLKGRNNIFTRLELIRNIQNGVPGFSANYEMLEGLQPGFNATWQVFLTWYLNKNLELSVTYDGRASENKAVLHTGRVQLKAFF